jgi:hypothetical protein
MFHKNLIKKLANYCGSSKNILLEEGIEQQQFT